MSKKMLITGGAGFIGANSALYFAKRGWDITILDNLSRRGAPKNLEWLKENGVPHSFVKADIRHERELDPVFAGKKYDVVLHLAAQVAVTLSVSDPRHDFETNAIGTFNVLEGVRKYSPECLLIYASTNKVYGLMENVAVMERNGRYEYAHLPDGITESQPLDFHSPYGCSKGAADQYVLDYAKIYGLRTTSFRQSCIYGKRQFGIEDQGWIAWFIIASSLNKKITIYGDGKQIRDVLYVDDLIQAYEAAINQQDKCTGQAFNVGGGSNNTLSLLELIGMLDKKLSKKINPGFDRTRPGDQPVFVCNLDKIKNILSWHPTTGVSDGVSTLMQWVHENKSLFG